MNVNYFEVLKDVNGKEFLVEKPCPRFLIVLASAINESREWFNECKSR